MRNVQQISGKKKKSNLLKFNKLQRIGLKLLICIPVLILCWQIFQKRPVSIQFFDKDGTEQILSISAQDRKKLYDLMELIFADDSFAYTILGSKPVSWANYCSPFPYVTKERFFDSFRKYSRKLRIGWKAWSKYSHFFPGANFWMEENPKNPGLYSILIVNPPEFDRVVKQNKEDFDQALGKEILSGYQLLNQVKDCSLIDEVLQNHQVLIGIALGYGKKNAQMFQESCRTLVPAGWVWKENEMGEELDEIPPGMTLTEFYLDQYSCPSFAGDPDSEESQELKKSYLETKAKVLRYYKGKDFLGATLSLLAGYRPE